MATFSTSPASSAPAYAGHAPAGRHAALGLFGLVFTVGTGFLLFGDYLALSASYVATGETANWIAATAATQLLILPFGLFAGAFRNVARQRETYLLLGVGAIMVIHALAAAVQGRGLNAYGMQKMAAWFLLTMPSLLIGMAAGDPDRPPPARWLVVFSMPLLVCCLISLAVEPARLTIDYYYRLYAYGGVLVQPAHQSLAFVLGKLALAYYGWSLVREAKPLHRRLSMLAFLTSATLIVLSGARGYTLAMLASLGVLWALLGKRQLLFAAVAIGIAGGLFTMLSSELVQERLDPTQALESLAYLERMHAWNTSWEAFLSEPLLGHGPGGFAEFDAWAERSYPHNVFLEFLSETGLVGMLLFLGLLGSLAHRMWRVRKEPLTGGRAFALGFFLFSLVGVQSVGDLIRNHFLFFAAGLLVTATRPRAGALTHR